MTATNSIAFGKTTIPLQNIDYFTMITGFTAGGDKTEPPTKTITKSTDRRDKSDLPPTINRLTLWENNSAKGNNHYTRIALHCESAEKVDEIAKELLKMKIPCYTNLPPKVSPLPCMQPIENPFKNNQGLGQGRWFEIYHDRITRDWIQDGKRTPKEQPSSQQELNDWCLKKNPSSDGKTA